MVASGRNARQHTVKPSACIKPLTPLCVAIVPVDQVPSVYDKARIAGVLVGLTNYARPLRLNLSLRIPKVDKGKRLALTAGCAKLKPLTPIGAVADTIGIERFG